jgi:hypothetical protein
MRSSTSGLTVVVLAGLILVLALLLLLPGKGETAAHSAFSTRSDGSRAFLLLLDELGYDARPFTGAPGELPGGAALVLAETPPEALPRPSPPGPQADPAQRAPLGRLDPLHYRRFLERGGILIALGGDATREFLTRDLGLAAVDAVAWLPARPVASIAFEDGVELSPGADPLRLAARAGLPERARVLGRDPAGDAFAVALPCGAGTLVLASPEADFLTNGELGTAQRALLLVRLLEAAGAPRAVLFDEYALGGWTPDSPIELAFGPSVFLFSAHLVLLAALCLVRAAWVRAFPRDPVPLARVSALARARTLARLLARSAPPADRSP